LLRYGVSLVLFVLALRHLGSARAGAYFSVAPSFGTPLVHSHPHYQDVHPRHPHEPARASLTKREIQARSLV